MTVQEGMVRFSRMSPKNDTPAVLPRSTGSGAGPRAYETTC